MERATVAPIAVGPSKAELAVQSAGGHEKLVNREPGTEKDEVGRDRAIVGWMKWAALAEQSSGGTAKQVAKLGASMA